MRAAVEQLLDGRAVNEERLVQELAFLADKLDITEELVRFKAHAAAVRQTLKSDQPVGKQLGFLAQELGREVNTIGSKASPNDAPACGNETNSPMSRKPPIAVTTPSVIAR